MSVTAPRLTPIVRARSAREIGWCARTRFSTIWLLISREVPRVATLKREVLMLLIWPTLVQICDSASSRTGRDGGGQ